MLLGFCCAAQFRALADSTIVEGREFAWGANIGWINFRPDQPLEPDGAVIGQTFCSGLIWSAACGWINLGDGTPADGIRYANDDGADSGINHDGSGNLTGLAWGAAIGWINFGQDFDVAIPAPKVDLLTGMMSGYVWSASCGWIDLGENGEHVVATSVFKVIDSDGDDIDDGWERERLEAAGQPGNLDLLGSSPTADADGDLETDYQEYLADSDPFDRNDRFRVVSQRLDAGAMEVTITWASSQRRIYQLDHSSDLQAWIADFFSNGAAGVGTTSANAPWNPATVLRQYHRVTISLPLAP